MRNKGLLTLIALLVIASMVLVGCGGGSAEPTPAPAPVATDVPAPVVEEPTAAPVVEEPTATPEVAAAEEVTPTVAVEATPSITETTAMAQAESQKALEAAKAAGKTPVRWFVGLGTGTDPAQQEVQKAVVEEFNQSQDKIQLILEVIPYAAARDTLATQISSGSPPDLVGPVGWGGSNAFYGQWEDLAPYIESSGYDTTQFSDALVKFYQTEEGQVGLPFAVFPAATYFQKSMFDEAGLNYPPTKYGDKYVLPGGTEVDWNWDTLTNIGRYLTVDENGNSPVDLVDDAFVPNADFDATKIVQYGFVPQYQHPNHEAAFVGGAAKLFEVKDGKAVASIPDSWRAAWQWWYDGTWGDEPFIPSNSIIQSPEFGAGNPFNGGKIAMAVTHMWYTCCVANAGETWDLAVIPTNAEGTVNSRVDADTYRILKGSQNPEAAFEVMSYLIGPASLDLLTTYGGMPARADDQAAFFATKSEQYPFVENWDVMTQGLEYPDNPSAEGYMPNFNEAWDRITQFQTLLQSEKGLDLAKEIAKVEADLQVIFDKAGAVTLPEAAPAETAPLTTTLTITAQKAMAASAEAEKAALAAGKTPVRWFVGLGTGTDPAQQEVQKAVVEEFNQSQDEIQLILEVIPYAAARDTLATQISSGSPPDLVGPVGWGGSNAFYGQWEDLAPYIESSGYDTTQFSDALVKFYQTEEGQVGLPFAVFPAATYFQKSMFDEAGLNYPPTKYGDKYVLPGGTEVDWNWDTLTNIAKYLTVDSNGNAPVDLVDDAFVPNPDFDATQIVQYGYVPQYQHPNHEAAFVAGAAKLYEESGGKITASIPESWQEAWQWWYDGTWGEEPFIPSNSIIQSPEFGAGNPFNGGKIAMANTHMWYTCCVANAGETWDLAVIPTNAEGTVNSRVDADTYRILKGSKNPEAAFEVMSYLIGPASLDLLTTYGGMPARADDQAAFFATKSEQYPFVENWDVMTQGLEYPDNPSAEGYMPNFNEAWDRITQFQTLLQSEKGLDLAKEIAKVEADLQVIFDKAAK